MAEHTLVYLDSLGCAKNLVDSELALGLLLQAQFQLTQQPEAAAIVIVNTCGFINDAKEESIQRILELAELKSAGNCQVLVVTGCLVQKYREELCREIPEVDVWLGTTEYQTLVPEINACLQQPEAAVQTLPAVAGCQNRVLLTPGHYAYLKIAEGCNNCCSFCAIPLMRGKLQSRSLESLVAEAKELQAQGVRELVIIAQDTTAYGLDLYGKPMLPELLRRLAALPFPWIRVLYCYPNRLDAELLQTMAALPNVCHYFDIPIQHVSKQVLQRMGRSYGRQEIEALFDKIRQVMPDVAIRTTFLVGFPGETDEDFAELLDFARQQPLAWAGVFTYSREDGTKAYDMPDQVPEAVKLKRYNQLTAALGLASARHKQAWEGKTLEVVLEGPDEDLSDYFTARSRYHAPEVDGVILVENHSSALTAADIGSFGRVKIHTAEAYDLFGTWQGFLATEKKYKIKN